MTQARVLADLADAAVLAAFCAALLFIGVYSAVAPWWRSAIGRALVIMDAGIALTLLPPVLHVGFGLTEASVFYAWFEISALALVAGSTLWRSWIVLRVQRDAAGEPVAQDA